MGGTRFVGKAIVEEFQKSQNEITLFTRGKNSLPNNVLHIKGDRNNYEDLLQLKNKKFDLVVDTSGRNKDQTKHLIDVIGAPLHRLIYISSAGVYKKTENYPYSEESEVDEYSRHYGKVETENWLIEEGIPFTSFRPTYIYGPGNYNPIERWFFDRVCKKTTIPIPNDGQIITQLGHVKDLAIAINISKDNDIAKNKIYNCSGNKSISIIGLIKTVCSVCNVPFNSIDVKSFDISRIDSKARKLFPIRLNHFMTDISLIKTDLNWEPHFNLLDGLRDSFEKDYKVNDVTFNNDNDSLLFE